MASRPVELLTDRLCAGYAGTVAIEDISLNVAQGRRLGILGRNGAGKTTTLAAIMGLARSCGGSVHLDGVDLGGMPVYMRARAGLGYVAQTRNVFPSLTVEQNLLSALQGHPRGELDRAWSLFPRLRERRTHYGNQLSGGEQQMLAVARALVGQPRILLLDEPLEGLAPKLAEELMEAITQLVQATGVGCILVEQHVDVVLAFSDDVLVLERGRAAFQGTVAALRERPEVLDWAIGLALAAG